LRLNLLTSYSSSAFYSSSFFTNLRLILLSPVFSPISFFFFNDTATTEIYTLSLHDALPISVQRVGAETRHAPGADPRAGGPGRRDRKSTRLNSSHVAISYAVFCLKKKKRTNQPGTRRL